jgi:hypothetical protein
VVRNGGRERQSGTICFFPRLIKISVSRTRFFHQEHPKGKSARILTYLLVGKTSDKMDYNR